MPKAAHFAGRQQACRAPWGQIMIDKYRSLPSIADVLNANRGEGPGFNFMRLALAILILGAHSSWIAGKDITQDWVGLHGLFLLSLVPAFFALSGFLVTGSALRTNAVRPFIALRLIRIVPALFVEVVLSAIIFGPLLTTYALSDYFTDVRFFEYFGNIVGRIRFELPGLFEANPVPHIVNVNLWTLKPEFYCYILMAAMLALNVFRSRELFTGFLALMIVVATIASYAFGFGISEGNYHWTIIVFFFFVGCATFQWREYIRLHWALFAASAAISVAIMSMDRQLAFLVTPFFTYCVVYIGMLPLRLPKAITRFDVSYGIYLYGFPIQQTLVSQFEWTHHNGLVLFLVAAPLTILFASLSWVFVEKPFLKLKPYVTGTIRQKAAA